ncbi:LPXTG cell wall anchor domain-containing protein [Saccharomonospora halophila]|uniref:LPXTG cell wall anchor domain-containing protein n=1 Tax=Saccharomonospora halophila TaxID=129922 RepID=UPI002FBDC039
MSRFRPRTVAAGLACGLLVGTATATAGAVAAEEQPGEDPRAVAHGGNTTTCEEYEGGILVSYGDDGDVENVPELVYERGVPEQNRFVDITEVPERTEVTAIVVKGANGYNVYKPGENGLPGEPAWTDLRAPLNGGGNIPAISHWFACGYQPTETTSETPTSEPDEPTRDDGPDAPGTSSGRPTTGTEPGGETPTGTEVTTTGTGGSGTTPQTTETTVSPVNENDDLASTGFGSGWLIALGAALLLGGGALLALTRIRRSRG